MRLSLLRLIWCSRCLRPTKSPRGIISRPCKCCSCLVSCTMRSCSRERLITSGSIHLLLYTVGLPLHSMSMALVRIIQQDAESTEACKLQSHACSSLFTINRCCETHPLSRFFGTLCSLRILGTRVSSLVFVFKQMWQRWLCLRV